jgi:hypothetical protein
MVSCAGSSSAAWSCWIIICCLVMLLVSNCDTACAQHVPGTVVAG